MAVKLLLAASGPPAALTFPQHTCPFPASDAVYAEIPGLQGYMVNFITHPLENPHWKTSYPQHFNRDIHKLSTLSTIGLPGLADMVDRGRYVQNLSFLLRLSCTFPEPIDQSAGIF